MKTLRQLEKEQRRNDLIAFAALAVMLMALPVLYYTSITNELCKRIERGVYDSATQADMKLNKTECAKPWYAKL